LIGIESDDYDVNLLKEIVCADLHRDETGCPSNSIIRKASLITRFHQHPEIVALLFAGLEAPLLNQIDLDLTQELSIPIPDLQYPETPLYLEQLLDKEQPLLPPPNSWRPEGNVTQSQDTTSGLAAIRLKNVLSSLRHRLPHLSQLPEAERSYSELFRIEEAPEFNLEEAILYAYEGLGTHCLSDDPDELLQVVKRRRLE